jgi:hypothetical protein
MLEQVADIFDQHPELVERKVPQGFDYLELTPLAIPAARLMDLMKTAILKHAAEGTIFQTRRFPSDIQFSFSIARRDVGASRPHGARPRSRPGSPPDVTGQVRLLEPGPTESRGESDGGEL